MSATLKKILRSVLKGMKNKIIGLLLCIATAMTSLTWEAQGATLCDFTQYEEDDLQLYLDICHHKEEEYSEIPQGFLEAILMSPPSSIYDVGVMHINPEDYALIMWKLKVTDLEKPTSNIAVASERIAQLFNKYDDPYLVLINYFNATEEKDMYILDVYRNYLIINSVQEYYRRR